MANKKKIAKPILIRDMPASLVSTLDAMAEGDRRSRNEEVAEILDRVAARWTKGERLDEILPRP